MSLSETKIHFDPKDLNILNQIVQSYNTVIVGEENNTKFLWCLYLSKDLPRKYRLHAIIASQSSAGKTSLIRRVSEPFKAHVIDYTDFTAALLKLGRYPEAIECYEKALAIDGNDIFALNNKGSALFDWLQMGLIVKSN
jgi:tetratricopeptide (TPR) repeat protein